MHNYPTMKVTEENIVAQKSKNFALRCIKLYKYLTNEQKEFVLSKQLLRSGTSIGANIKEAIRGQSKADFGAKMNIALKEASETEYWIDLLTASEYLTPQQGNSILTARVFFTFYSWLVFAKKLYPCPPDP